LTKHTDESCDGQGDIDELDSASHWSFDQEDPDESTESIWKPEA